ncbi:Calcium-activated chloride channel regulator 1 [Holothuria leucospilota]|uniref:Calcium-activated chloride channel regulator 1 n=1 Tax=Holothuria leucospilota TaxID=206669 RepID=A0A9Q1BZT5_HOLLE|nr:Calcium-activated chloride channel regulator 1 [Holothuria leucospilota]
MDAFNRLSSSCMICSFYLLALMITLSSTQDNAAYQAPFYQNFRPLQLVEGGYKGLVVAISPQIPEDDELVQSIKTVLTDFSSYLYNITNERIYLREVRILIPSTWDDKVRYVTAVSERFEESDLRIDVTPEEENLQIRNLPFTNKPTFCGSQGFYIHLTPDYLKNQTISSLYGSYNKVLAHEWAHYRWGVFDEYPRRDGPHFYLSSTGLIEGVRCTASITGEEALWRALPATICRVVSLKMLADSLMTERMEQSTLH